MPAEYNISIITINYNGLKDTCQLIDSIPIEQQSIEMIVVDNASANDEATNIESRYPNITVIRSESNLGFAGGNNLGIKASHGKYLFFLNNDTYFEHFDISALVTRLASSPNIGVVCPKIRFAYGDQLIQFAGYTPLSLITIRNQSIGFGKKDEGQYAQPHTTPYAHGAAMMVKRDVIDSVGLMPEEFFLYYEELDWSMQITRAGYEIWYEPGCTIFHKESQTTGTDSPLREYYLTRNRLLLAERNVNAPVKYISYLYLICIVALRNICKNIFRGRSDLAGATWSGIISFLKME
jgi:GT2 family glycosyltransferase